MTVRKLTARAKSKPGKHRAKPKKAPRRKLTVAAATRQMRHAQQRAIVGALRKGVDRITAAGAAKVSRATLYRWFNEDPAFLQRCVAAERKCIADVQSVNWREALKPEGRADRMKFLDSRGGYKSRIDLGIEDEPPAGLDDGRPDLQTMDQDDLDEYIAKLTAARK